MKFLSRLLPVAVVFLVVATYSKFQSAPTSGPTEPSSVGSEPLRSPPLESEPKGESFRCDGRTYCSEMTSCAEAKFFLNHCPNVKMDGDHDGVPCESQWCRSG